MAIIWKNVHQEWLTWILVRYGKDELEQAERQRGQYISKLQVYYSGSTSLLFWFHQEPAHQLIAVHSKTFVLDQVLWIAAFEHPFLRILVMMYVQLAGWV